MVAGRHETAHRRNIPPVGIAITMGRVSLVRTHVHTVYALARSLSLPVTHLSGFSPPSSRCLPPARPDHLFLLHRRFISFLFISSSTPPDDVTVLSLFLSPPESSSPRHPTLPLSLPGRRALGTRSRSDVICIIPVSPPRRSAAQLLAGI